MELRTLRYFVAIAEAGTVTAAAAALHFTQPSVSRQVRQLERQLGLDLFVRDEGRLRLSAAGRAFLPLAPGCWLRPTVPRPPRPRSPPVTCLP